MHFNAAFVFAILLVVLSSRVRKTEAAACGLKTGYTHYVVHDNGDFKELCKADYDICLGGCPGKFAYDIHEQDSNDATDHCDYGIDCCKMTSSQYSEVSLYDCSPLPSAPEGSVSQGPFTQYNVKMALTCSCEENCFQGGTTNECSNFSWHQ